MHVIIQAGGKGTRLESLTRNRPKCLVPVDNRPMIFWTFEAFKGADFSVISRRTFWNGISRRSGRSIL